MRILVLVFFTLIAIAHQATGHAYAACVAHALRKLPYSEYRARVLNHFNKADFPTLLKRSNNPNNYFDVYFSNGLADTLNKTIEDYYNKIYDPKDIVCIAEDDAAAQVAASLITYGGTKVILLPLATDISGENDGIFGRNLELLNQLQQIIVKRAKQFRDSLPPPGNCWRDACISRYAADKTYEAYNRATQNFLPSPPGSYLEYAFLSDNARPEIGDASILDFYHRVAAQSYIDSAIGSSRNFSIQIGASEASFAGSLYDPTNTKFLPTRSLLDFVEGQWSWMLTSYYSSLFQVLLTAQPEWELTLGSSSTLSNTNQLLETKQSNTLPAIVAEFYCELAKSNNGSLPYDDLIAKNKRVYLGNHIAFFCDVWSSHDTKLLDVEQILKTDHTFPTTLPILAGESGNRDILEQLNVLAELNVDQNALLKDIKNLIGSEQFQNKLSKLQESIRVAESAARGPGIGQIVELASAIGSIYPGVGQMASGALVVASQIHGAATSNEPMIYLLSHQESLEDGSKKISEGAAKLNRLISLMGKLSPRAQARADVKDLRSQLEDIQRQYREFQADIRRVSQRQQEQYLRAAETYELLQERRAGIYLDIQAALNEVSLKDLIGGRVVKAGPSPQRQCRRAADAFSAAANETTFGSLNDNCSRYLSAFSAIADCIETLPVDRGTYVAYDGQNTKVGLLLARDRGTGSCLHELD